VSASLEEASRCPKCKEQGAVSALVGGRRGSRVYTYTCQNDKCIWYNTGWVVQVNSDGTIPERPTAGPKQYPKPSQFSDAMAKRQIEDLAKAGDQGAIDFLKNQ
jgi:hypothetical protein